MKILSNTTKAGIFTSFWMLAIFLLSNEPATQSSARSGRVLELLNSSDVTGSDIISTFLVRKAAHTFMFLVLGVLIYALMRSFSLTQKKLIGLSILSAGLYAVTDEIHQTFIPGRSAELRDVLIDTVGASLGVLTALYIGKLYRKKQSAKPSEDTRHVYLRWFNTAIAVGLGVLYAITAISVYSSQLLPTKVVLFVGLLLGLATALLFYVQITNKSSSYIKNIAATMASVALVGILVATVVFTSRTNTFIGSLQGVDYEDQPYSIVTIIDSGVELNQDNQSIGYIEDDPNGASILEEVGSRTGATPKSYEDITTLAVALTNKEIDSLVLRDTYLQLLDENYNSFYSDLKVLDTFNLKVKKNENIKQPDVTQPFIVYISGIDTYGDVTKVSRSDVNILAVINPITNKILLVNTPRDYYVQLHGTSGNKDKLTHAGIYGIDTSRATLEDLYDVDIDFYVRINFSSLIDVVDELGGVTVQSDHSFTSGKYTFGQGSNELDGQSALAFSRTRYGFADGDRTRGKNQQKVITAIIEKAINPSVIVRNQGLMNAVNSTIQTDASDTVITKVIKQQLETIGQWQVDSISVTGSDSRGYTHSMGRISLYVMEPNIESLNTARNKIQQYAQ